MHVGLTTNSNNNTQQPKHQLHQIQTTNSTKNTSTTNTTNTTNTNTNNNTNNINTPHCLIIHSKGFWADQGPRQGHRTWSGVPVRGPDQDTGRGPVFRSGSGPVHRKFCCGLVLCFGQVATGQALEASTGQSAEVPTKLALVASPKSLWP